jgi:hypothetical protein
LTVFLDKPSQEEDHRDLGRKKRVSFFELTLFFMELRGIEPLTS